MSEIPSSSGEKKKKRARGFAGTIESQLAPLNTSDYFKQKYGMDDFVLLLIATDDNHAALITVKEGQVVVDGIKNKPDELSQVKYNGMIKTSSEYFMLFAMGKVNPVKAILTGKLKIKGFRVVLRFTKYFGILAFIMKQQKAQEQIQNPASN